MSRILIAIVFAASAVAAPALAHHEGDKPLPTLEAKDKVKAPATPLPKPRNGGTLNFSEDTKQPTR